MDGFQLPKGIVPWRPNGPPWRRLKPEFLSRLPAFKWYDDTSGYDRILFPIGMGGELVGYTAGRLDRTREYPDEDEDPKYRSSRDLPSKEGFALLDQIRYGSTLVIVEGIYDCLRLLQAGIPAICNLGARSVWTREKAELLLSRPKLKRVMLAFDNDRAGALASEAAMEDLADDLDVYEVELPDPPPGQKKVDPGDAPSSWVRQFRKDMRGLGWNGRCEWDSVVELERRV